MWGRKTLLALILIGLIVHYSHKNLSTSEKTCAWLQNCIWLWNRRLWTAAWTGHGVKELHVKINFPFTNSWMECMNGHFIMRLRFKFHWTFVSCARKIFLSLVDLSKIINQRNYLQFHQFLTVNLISNCKSWKIFKTYQSQWPFFSCVILISSVSYEPLSRSAAFFRFSERF